MEGKLSYLRTNSLGILFIVLYLTDFISKYGLYYHTILENVSSVLKLILQILIVAYVFIKKEKEGSYAIISLAVLGFFVTIGHLFIVNDDNSFFSRISNNLKIFDWYIFIFILMVGVNSFLGYSNDNKSQIPSLAALFKAFEIVFYINSFFIILGFIFNIEILKAYYHERFGYNGLLRNSTHASYIYIIYIIYFYYNNINLPTKKNKVLFISSILISLFIATKALLLFNVLLIVYLLFSVKAWKTLTISFCIVFGMILNFDILLNTIMKNHFEVLYNVYNDKGLFTMLFSLRNERVVNEFIPYITEHWSIINYFFGGGDFNVSRTEIELLDFFWFFGIIGFAYFFWIWNRYILNFKELTKYRLCFLLLSITLLAGNFFSSAPVMTFFLIFILYLKTISVDNSDLKRYEL